MVSKNIVIRHAAEPTFRKQLAKDKTLKVEYLKANTPLSLFAGSNDRLYIPAIFTYNSVPSISIYSFKNQGDTSRQEYRR